MACIAFADRIPHPMTVRALRENPHQAVTARLAGEVIDARGGERHVLTRREDNADLVPFSMEDDTDEIEVWVPTDDLPRQLTKGDHVRIWGRYVAMDIEDARSRTVKSARQFVASSVSVDAR